MQEPGGWGCVPAEACPAKAVPSIKDPSGSVQPARCEHDCPSAPDSPSFSDPASADPNLCLYSYACPDGTYGNTETYLCEPCAVQGCKQCAPGGNVASQTPTTCFICQDGFFKMVCVLCINGKHAASCISSISPHTLTACAQADGTCAPCTDPGCGSCDDASTCTRCKDGFWARTSPDGGFTCEPCPWAAQRCGGFDMDTATTAVGFIQACMRPTYLVSS